MRRDDRGASSVEFALVVPILLVLIAVAGYFAWQLYTESQLERAAQRAARYAAVPTTEGTYAFRHCDVVDAVNSHLTTTSVDASSVTVADADTTLTQVPCPGGDAAGRPRGYVRVRVTRVLDNPFSDLVGFLSGSPGGTTITASGEARVEDAS